MTFIVVCGGTAGHVNPGLSIADKIKEREPDAKILFIGAGRDIEKNLVPAAGYELINIKMTGLRRSFTPSAIWYNTKSLLSVLSARKIVVKILKREKPSAVIGTGGYICYPVLKEAARRKIPTFIHESNARPGMTVRLLSAIADKVMITYTGFNDCYKSPERLVITGTPVRKEIAEISNNTLYSTKKDKKLVVSFWGSLGAERMNEIMEEFITLNTKEKSFHHIHATGKGKGTFSLKTNPPFADIREYINDMPKLMADADLILCRAGGITIAELTASGKPSILVPSPYVPDNVQYENAKKLAEHGAALLTEESECTGKILYNKVLSLINDEAELIKMSEAAIKIGRPKATDEIADIIFDFIKSK